MRRLIFASDSDIFDFKKAGTVMSEIFSRTEALIGRDNLDKLKDSRVAVFGLGGVGGHCAEALCRSGVGSIDLFDGDVVDVTNINRQLIATHKTVGRDKTEVMRERLLEINPEVKIEARKIFYLPETADGIDLSVYDHIVDAVDTITAKLELVCRAAKLGVPIISAMGAANKLDPAAFMVADIFDTSVCPMARIMRSELRKRGTTALKVVYSKETRQDDRGTGVLSSIAFVPPVVGLIMAGEVVKSLTSRP